MATINDGELYLEISNADEQGLRRGLAAARGSLDVAQVDLKEAFQAGCKLEQGIEVDEWILSEDDERLGDIWFEAQQAAFDASGVDWRKCDRARLASWRFEQQSRAEMERMMAKNPGTELIPPPDPGPHFRI
jgi:hypothetical protein